MTKAEQEERERQEAWEKEQAKNGMITLPRSGEPGAPDYQPEKKKPAEK